MISVFACNKVESSKVENQIKINTKDSSEIEKYIHKNSNDTLTSESIGTVSNGQLKNGKLLPFEGTNYRHFDTACYLQDRAYLNDKLLSAVLETYTHFEIIRPKRRFTIMECSGKHGGPLHPHRTHQNGLSIDFMMPLLKDGAPCYDYDNTGQEHYLLDFNDAGQLTQDTAVAIDFELVAQHILVLDSIGKPKGVGVKKVIINTDLKDELFAGKYGKKLMSSGIYVVQSLTPLINGLHDDHYHVDFGIE